jgi:hypothetical protein
VPERHNSGDVKQKRNLCSPFGETLLLILAAAVVPCRAQELEPRSYSPNPTGARFLALGYVHSSGDVLLDPSVPLSNVEARLNAGAAAYGRTFDAFGRSAIASLALPYAWGKVSGVTGEGRREVSRSGLADMRLRVGMNLLGGPALSAPEFALRRPQTTLGVSLTAVAPSGQYDPHKLVNIGSNRWSFKPELGLSYPRGDWYFEGYAGVWLFTENDDFYGGSRRKQDPITTLQAHVVYTFRPQLWIAFDVNHYGGGATSTNGVRSPDQQSNTRVGFTISVPAAEHHSLKLTWSDGVATRLGSDFSTYGVAWQYAWVN